MKKILAAVLLALAVSGFAQAAVEAGAGTITLFGHVDFVGRYSEPDTDQNWPGYETYNLEYAVLGVAGREGDNVSWIISHAFAFMGPQGSLNSALAASNNDVAGHLLDARINVHLGDNLTFSAGRFIPPTSMTWGPHFMDVLHTVNQPLINGSGINGGMIIPLPMYQTGVMLTGAWGPLCLQVGSFNGSGTVGLSDAGGVFFPGISNTMDIDKSKSTVAKAGLMSGGFGLAGWYVGETASANWAGTNVDGKIGQWGVEAAYESEVFLLQGQYKSSAFDTLDSGVSDDLIQHGWYVLGGVSAGPAMIVARYDYVNYDEDGLLLSKGNNEEKATTLGVNYKLNGAATAGLDYTWRDIEGWDGNTNELAFILEVDLF